MDRQELGERLCQWHGSMSDPIYAVGSFYVDGQVYPDKEVVESALTSLTSTLSENRRMLIGEKVWVERGGKRVDLKVFAGYTQDDLRENIADLEEITEELQRFMTEDYNA